VVEADPDAEAEAACDCGGWDSVGSSGDGEDILRVCHFFSLSLSLFASVSGCVVFSFYLVKYVAGDGVRVRVGDKSQ
jgi:hypothetical protein